MVTGFDISELRQHIRDAGRVVRVVIVEHKGSTPRETGTSMLVTETGQVGTIGGGVLEFEAAADARNMLQTDGNWQRAFSKIPLGPNLGQCCGGSVSLLAECYGETELAHLETLQGPFVRPITSGEPTELPLPVQKHLRSARSGASNTALTLLNGWLIEPLETPQQPLWIYGAGHVGRALVTTLEGLPFAVTWVDSARDRFPTNIPPHADMLVAANPADAVAFAPDDAQHVVLTYSHSIDLEICLRVLNRAFGGLGLIGSDTKRTRFIRRLTEAGADASRLECPIGNRALGKEPMAIAVGVTAGLLEQLRVEKQKMREVSA
ncbi:xanthine dehydrogenase accessory protein XdhC [Rhodobacterales bacterium 52_120_T64]|nr:xanthine dehydrogenase accessory protein XdhC [Rhodobacterales bacterium 52_120_T64]